MLHSNHRTRRAIDVTLTALEHRLPLPILQAKRMAIPTRLVGDEEPPLDVRHSGSQGVSATMSKLGQVTS
jgi:hypothetical protein